MEPERVARVEKRDGREVVSVSTAVSKYEPSSKYSMDTIMLVDPWPLAKMDTGMSMAITVTNEIGFFMIYALFILDSRFFFCHNGIF